MHQRAIFITCAPISNNRIQERRVIVIVTATGTVLCTQTLYGQALVLIVRLIAEAVGMAVGVCVCSVEPETREKP